MQSQSPSKLGADGYAVDWTERPHWTAVAWDAGERMSVTHWPTRELAERDARRMRRVYAGPMRTATVEPVR